MNCPIDGTALRERERQLGGNDMIVMDICPSCGGIWLDKGELEKLTSAETRYYEGDRREVGAHRTNDSKKRGGFLGSILEGFGGEE